MSDDVPQPAEPDPAPEPAPAPEPEADVPPAAEAGAETIRERGV